MAQQFRSFFLNPSIEENGPMTAFFSGNGKNLVLLVDTESLKATVHGLDQDGQPAEQVGSGQLELGFDNEDNPIIHGTIAGTNGSTTLYGWYRNTDNGEAYKCHWKRVERRGKVPVAQKTRSRKKAA